MKKIAGFLLILFVCVQAWAQNDEAKKIEEANVVKVGSPVPDFSFLNGAGKKESMSAYKGKVTVVVFFATWCGPCRQELPHIEKEIWDKSKDKKDFALLIFGREHKKAEVDKFRTENKFTMPFLADPDRSVYSKFAKSFIPRLYLVDKSGKIVYATVGYNDAEFSKMLDTLQKAF
ncbi:MAG: TlpA disulfide reductase family protein [Bacteroidota bacterium]|nr:TlpA disulfide reductase family protein [Bacteroidota bacterium]